MARTEHVDVPGLIDAICKLQPDQLEGIATVIHGLQLLREKPVNQRPPKLDLEPTPAPQPRATAQRNGRIRATAKTIEVAECLLSNGAMSKEQLVERLGWSLQAVSTTLARSKRHFTRRDDGTYLVGPQLAAELEK